MEIAELRRGMSNVNVRVHVDEVGETRTVSTKYGNKKLAEATVSDSSGSAILTLWEEQIDQVNAGQEYDIKDAYVTEYKGEVKINVPKRGQIAKV